MKRNKLAILLNAWMFPIQDSWTVWWYVIQGKEIPERFWEDISFFHLFNEDFFEWYYYDFLLKESRKD